MTKATTMERSRAWQGPAVLSFGFRPFFLLGAVWVALAMALWAAMLAGKLTLPTAFDPVSWHAHEFLFGYLGAIIAGFLLTAVPNWTGRLPVTGWPLAALAGLGLRLGLAAAVMMVAVIGGRIVPSFTRNWLAKQEAGRLPVPPMQRFDAAALGVLLAALLA
jgi:uncharacterized protein involved in response to NO